MSKVMRVSTDVNPNHDVAIGDQFVVVSVDGGHFVLERATVSVTRGADPEPETPTDAPPALSGLGDTTEAAGRTRTSKS